MTGVKRYHVEPSEHYVAREVWESADGEWVKFEDHQAEVARLRAEVEKYRKDAERYRWLCEDHSDFATRKRRNDLLEYFRVRSYSGNSTAIDAAISIGASA